MPRRFDSKEISRRRLLRWAALGAGAVLARPVAFGGPAAAASDGEPWRIVVLGAGLAGLAAGYELARAGYEVTVLEGRSTPGGRVRTLRDPFADGLYAEAGALAFSHAYLEANRYIDELDLERVELQPPKLPSLYLLGGRRFTAAAGQAVDWPYPLTEQESALGPFGLMRKYLVEPLAADLADLGDPVLEWQQTPWPGLDEISLGELMRRNGASEGAIALVRATQYFAKLPEETSAESVALSDLGTFFAAPPFVLAGGNDRLPAAMAAKLGRRAHLDPTQHDGGRPALRRRRGAGDRRGPRAGGGSLAPCPAAPTAAVRRLSHAARGRAWRPAPSRASAPRSAACRSTPPRCSRGRRSRCRGGRRPSSRGGPPARRATACTAPRG